LSNDDPTQDKPVSEIVKKEQQTAEETSFGKDFFIVAGGIAFVILIFFLYRALAGLDLDIKIPEFSGPIIDAWGNPVEGGDKTIDPQLIQGFFRVGFICAVVGFFAFLFFSILLKWPKHIRRKLAEKKKRNSPPGRSANLP